MDALSKGLYRFRGYILAVMGIALIAVPPGVHSLAALPLFLAGAALRIRARQFIGSHTRGSKHEAESLVVDGPYACTRHPLYISNTLIALSAILFHLGTDLMAIPFAVAVFCFEAYLAHAENRFLEKKFGDTWRAWTPSFGKCFKSRANANARPKRSFSRAFCDDWATWVWLLLYNLVLLSRKTFLS